MAKTTTLGLDENIEALLTYVLGWLTGIVFFALEKKSKFVRFHAMQSIIVFLGLTVAYIVVGIIPLFGWMLSALVNLLALALWIILMIRAYKGEKFKVPIAGDMAEKYI